MAHHGVRRLVSNIILNREKAIMTSPNAAIAQAVTGRQYRPSILLLYRTGAPGTAVRPSASRPGCVQFGARNYDQLSRMLVEGCAARDQGLSCGALANVPREHAGETGAAQSWIGARAVVMFCSKPIFSSAFSD